MTFTTRFALFALPLFAACTDADTVDVQLAPEVISSLDGTLQLQATVIGGQSTLKDESVDITVAYTDRNGVAHDIAPVHGKTNDRGVFETSLTGLVWDGSGTITAATGKVTGTATFAVLDRTPPTVAITPPPNNQVRLNSNVTIPVHITDEIGTSQVFFETSSTNNQFRNRTTIIASGSGDTTVNFELQVPDNVPTGTTITLYALGEDLSGNQGAATPVVVTVTP